MSAGSEKNASKKHGKRMIEGEISVYATWWDIYILYQNITYIYSYYIIYLYIYLHNKK